MRTANVARLPLNYYVSRIEVRDSVGRMLTRRGTGRRRKPGPIAGRGTFSAACPHWLWAPPSLLHSGYRGRGNKAEHLPSSRAEVMNQWSYTSIPHTPSKCAQGQFYLYLYNFPRFNLEIWPISFAFGGRMKGLMLLRNVSYAISYSNTFIRHHIQPGLPRAYRDYPKVIQSSPTCCKDDRALWFPHLHLLYYFPPISLVYVSEPKALVPILRPRKEVPRMANAQTQYPSICLMLHSPLA